MPRLPDLKDRLAALPDDPTASDLQPLAEEIASRCRVEPYPRKSVAAVLRHARPALSETTAATLEECVWSALDGAAKENVEQKRKEGSSQPWPGLVTVSKARGISAEALAGQLRIVRYRRLYGWPWWDGHRWSFNPAIIDPMLCARYMADLPDDEPAAHVAMLPEWCLRADSEPEGSESAA